MRNIPEADESGVDYLCMTSSHTDGVGIAAVIRKDGLYEVGLVVGITGPENAPVVMPLKPGLQWAIAEGYDNAPKKDRFRVGNMTYKRLRGVDEVVESFKPQPWFDSVVHES